ncbi:MAG: hypothetical protein QM784_29270 [Polyangiaceae bacterium]
MSATVATFENAIRRVYTVARLDLALLLIVQTFRILNDTSCRTPWFAASACVAAGTAQRMDARDIEQGSSQAIHAHFTAVITPTAVV